MVPPVEVDCTCSRQAVFYDMCTQVYVCMCTWYTVCACYMHAWRTRVCACVRAYACIATVYKHTHEHVAYVGWLICLESLMSTPPLMYVQSKHTPSHSLYLQFPSLR